MKPLNQEEKEAIFRKYAGNKSLLDNVEEDMRNEKVVTAENKVYVPSIFSRIKENYEHSLALNSRLQNIVTFLTGREELSVEAEDQISQGPVVDCLESTAELLANMSNLILQMEATLGNCK